MPTAAAADLTVRLHAGRDAVDKLAGPLRAAGLLPVPVIEMDPEYLAAGFEQRPGAVVAYSGDRPVAYVPYALRHTRFPIALGPASLGRFPCRQLVVFGYAADVPDDAPALDRLSRLLLGLDGWDVAQAFQLPFDHPLARYLARNPFGGGHLCRAVPRTYDTIQVAVQPTFERYLNEQFSRKTRYNLRREVRRLETSARVAAIICSSARDVPRFLRDAEAIARKTYHRRLGLSTVTETAEELRRVSYLAERGRWRGYLLAIDDTPAAYCDATVRWDALSYDAIGYDPAFAHLNPGKVLLYKVLEDLHDWRGVTRLEFGRGAAEYKRLFANARAREFDTTLYRATGYAGMLRRLALFAESGYHLLRPLVRPCMPYVKRSLQHARQGPARRPASAGNPTR